MHNNIMAAGSRDRPPMLATGRYAQWRSRFLRYIDTRPNGDALRNSEQTTVSSYEYDSLKQSYFESKKRSDTFDIEWYWEKIYSIVDACQQLKLCRKPRKRDKQIQKCLALIAKHFKNIYKPTNNNLRTSSNTRNKNVDTTPRSPKRVKDSTYHKEKMLLCKQAEKGVQLQVEQSDWLADMDEEIDEQELEAHYSYIAKIRSERPTFANPMYLKKAQYEKPCLYAIPHDQSDPANRLILDREETLTLEEESR
ncbi:hypothetical protein Tco_0863849 [Tanacetum coccineum]